MNQGTLQVNTEKILPIIKKWLYSEKDIFLRELVSNSCDALSKLKILQKEGHLPSDNLGELRIDIEINKEKKTLTISDTGIGMTAAEVEKYIAQLAFSGAEEFLTTYKSQDQNEQMIGHFGLGFYSAYMVAEKVEIDTLSYQSEAQPALWSCDGGAQYFLSKGTRQNRGTTITLFIGEENLEYLEETKLKEILSRYCAFLPFPIHLNGEHINRSEPLWNKSPTECTEQDYLDFYRQLYPGESKPVFWVHLSVDFPFHLRGILYFPKIHQRFDYQDNRTKLFCNRVFVAENCKELLPDYLTILRGAIDSPDIPLNVSRSFLSMDKTVKQLSAHISKKISDRLNSLLATERQKLCDIWEDIEVVVKLGAIQDEKFYERVKPCLLWKTVDGNSLTIEEYIAQQTSSSEGKIFYTVDEHLSPSLLKTYKNKGLNLLKAGGPLDSALMNAIESKNSKWQFQRVDGALDTSLIDNSREKTLLDAEGKTEAVRIEEYVRSALKEDVEVEAKSLASDELPALLVLDEQARRMRDYLHFSTGTMSPNMVKPKLVVNTNSPTIQAIYKLKNNEPELATQLMQNVYELCLLSQKELPSKELPELIQRTHQTLERLLTRS